MDGSPIARRTSIAAPPRTGSRSLHINSQFHLRGEPMIRAVYPHRHRSPGDEASRHGPRSTLSGAHPSMNAADRSLPLTLHRVVPRNGGAFARVTIPSSRCRACASVALHSQQLQAPRTQLGDSAANSIGVTFSADLSPRPGERGEISPGSRYPMRAGTPISVSTMCVNSRMPTTPLGPVSFGTVQRQSWSLGHLCGVVASTGRQPEKG